MEAMFVAAQKDGVEGFIIRYPKGMEDVTGFPYEPWHYRYVGTAHAANIMNQGITLETIFRKEVNTK